MSVRNAILGLLAQSPRHGYELHTAFEALMGGEHVWDVKPSQIYTTLSRLEESGLVHQDNSPDENDSSRRVFAITPLGQEELLAWLTSGTASDYQHDEFYIKLMLCLVSETVTPYRVIQAQRSRLFHDLHDLTLRRSITDKKTEMAQLILIDKATMHIEADLRWLDMIESRLDDMRRHPPPAPEHRPRGRPKSG